MRKIVFRAHAHTLGTDAAELVEYPDDATAKELDDGALDFGYNHWDSYMPDIGDEDSDYEDEEQYYEDCDAWWEDYDPENHDGII